MVVRVERVKRAEPWKWRKGMPSPNPSGRPKSVAEVARLAREHTTEAILKLVQIMRATDNEMTAIAAC